MTIVDLWPSTALSKHISPSDRRFSGFFLRQPLWLENVKASESGGQEQRDAPERPRELPKSWREGERYFSQGVKEQFLREMRDELKV